MNCALQALSESLREAHGTVIEKGKETFGFTSTETNEAF